MFGPIPEVQPFSWLRCLEFTALLIIIAGTYEILTVPRKANLKPVEMVTGNVSDIALPSKNKNTFNAPVFIKPEPVPESPPKIPLQTKDNKKTDDVNSDKGNAFVNATKLGAC
jgi:hypothetical protein